MLKRQVNEETEGEPSKRSKIDALNSDEVAKPERPNYSRDPEYYFEDGNIILLVNNVLFKVHASLMKAQSQAFQDMLSMPSGDAANLEGCSEQSPIVIPQVYPSQFRNLLKMIYSPASSGLHASLQSFDKSDSTNLEHSVWNKFNFYLDVVTLSHRFEMVEMEHWAKKRLEWLTSTFTEPIASGANADPYALLNAIRYARVTSNYWLNNNIQNLTHYHFCTSDCHTGFPYLLSIFRSPRLRECFPSVFGCIFSVFLSGEHSEWEGELFTKVDRMALFSGQVRLSPIPESFTENILSPLFESPKSLERFREMIAPDPTNNQPPCTAGCDTTIMDIWLVIFTKEYYEGVNADLVGVGVSWLSILAQYRAKFFEQTREMKCRRNCNLRYISQLDRDIELIYVRLGEYYREIE